MRVLALLLSLALPLSAAAQTEVDVELYLAVDISRSMTPAELAIQREGYAAALRSDEVIGAIAGGLIGEIAVTYVEWAGAVSQRVVVPWTRVSNRAEAESVAALIAENPAMGLRRTSISGALLHATESIESNDFIGLRRVIDVSGDGPNNEGRPVLRARDLALSKGVTINGLPLMTRDGLDQRWYLEDLDEYYRHCVIGGPGAFAIPVRDWSEFALAVRRKLVLEIVGLPPLAGPVPVQFSGRDPAGYDCMIGEKIWEQNRRLWVLP